MATTYPVPLAGQRITASLLTSMLPITVAKAVDETVNNSNTLQNDNELVLAVTANAVYHLQMFLLYNTTDAADIKIAWTYPTGMTMTWTHRAFDSSITAVTGVIYMGALTEVNTVSMGGAGSNSIGLMINGLVRVSSTAGSLQLQWAQNSATAVNTKVLANSWMKLTRTA